MKKSRGSFNERDTTGKDIRQLTQQDQAGILNIEAIDLQVVSPMPDSWIMLKPGDLVVSKSGTIRFLLRKIWENGEAEFLRFKIEGKNGQEGAGLDLEKLDINSSNFDNLAFIMRNCAPRQKNQQISLSAHHFNKIVRFNILSLLGFGSLGSKLHLLVPALGAESEKDTIKVRILVDISNGQMYDLVKLEKSSNSPSHTSNNIIRTLEIDLFWAKDFENRIYKILGFIYPAGANAVMIESITLASEIANMFSVASACLPPSEKSESED